MIEVKYVCTLRSELIFTAGITICFSFRENKNLVSSLCRVNWFCLLFFRGQKSFFWNQLGKITWQMLRMASRATAWPQLFHGTEPMADLSLIANSARFFLIQDSDLSTYIYVLAIYTYMYIYIYIYIYTWYKILDMRYIIFDISYMIYYWSLWCLEDTRTCTMCFARVNLTVGAEWHISSPKFDP